MSIYVVYSVKKQQPNNLAWKLLFSDKAEKHVNKTYKYEVLPDRLMTPAEVLLLKNNMEQWWNNVSYIKDSVVNNKFNYELQVRLTSQAKRLREVNVNHYVENELRKQGYEFCRAYDTFFIPKKKKDKNGKIKYRRIDAPCEQLKTVLSSLSELLQNVMSGRTNHNIAYAYVKGRSHKDSISVHSRNKSEFYLSLDFKDFFSSITQEWAYEMLTHIYPFSEIVKVDNGAEILNNILSLCFLDGKLPQGTPVSPILTNILMIPIDYEIVHMLKYSIYSKNYLHKNFVITRYADDLLISSKTSFMVRKGEKIYPTTIDVDGTQISIVNEIERILKQFNSPITINHSKTKYTTTKGSNWHLGVIVNQQGEISLGHNSRNQLEAFLCNFVNDLREVNFTIEKLDRSKYNANSLAKQLGIINYHYQIEGDKTDKIIKKIDRKFLSNRKTQLAINLPMAVGVSKDEDDIYKQAFNLAFKTSKNVNAESSSILDLLKYTLKYYVSL